MVFIEKGRIDRATVIGAAVVFGIIGAAIFSVYYFGFVRPARAELEETRNAALKYVDTHLGVIDTSKAISATGEYKSRIRAAETKEEIANIQAEAARKYSLEKRREELLDMVGKVTKGSYHSFPGLEKKLKSEVKKKKDLDKLNQYESTIRSEVKSRWIDYHLNTIEDVPGDKVDLRIKNSMSPFDSKVEYNIPKENARSRVENEETLQSLQKMKFEKGGSYEVSIRDTFQRVPTIEPGTTVDVGVYDYASEEISIPVTGATVLDVIYPTDVLASVSWSYSDDGVTHTFSTDVWEQIKAGKAGDTDAERIWTDWAKDVVETARNANLGDYDLEALYVVEIHEQQDAKTLTQIEKYMTDEKDVILIAKI